MKTFFIVILAATFLKADEFTKKDGSKINASVVKYTPGVIQLKSKDGIIKDYSENDFKGASLAIMLPKDNVYEIALSAKNQIDFLLKTMEEQECALSNSMAKVVNSMSISSDKYVAVLNVIKKYEASGVLPESFITDISKAISKTSSNKSTQKSQNKYEIPQDVYERIKLEAEKIHPNDYSMQIFSIERQAKAYKTLKADE